MIEIQQVTILSRFEFDLVTALRAPQNMNVQRKWFGMAWVLMAITVHAMTVSSLGKRMKS